MPNLYIVTFVSQNFIQKRTIFVAYACCKLHSGQVNDAVGRMFKSSCEYVWNIICPEEKEVINAMLNSEQVDDAFGGILDGILPQGLKEKSFQACDVAKQVPEAVKTVVNELQTNGIISTAKTYYANYEPIAEEFTYAAWKQFLKLPCAPRAIHLAAPPTLFCAEKFNLVVHNLKELQVPFADYIPTVPVEKIEKVVKVQLG